MSDHLDSEQMFKELQDEASRFGGNATPVKLFITNRNIPSGQSDGFTTLIKFDPEGEQAEEQLENIVSTLYERNKGGLWTWSYQIYPRYSCCFVDMGPIVIKFPNQGESGNTVFDVYKDVVPDATKHKVAHAIAHRFGVRCTIIEGKANGFLIEKLPDGEYIYQLASSCRCTVKEVLRKIRAGWPLSMPTPEVLTAYKTKFYFFVQYEINEGTSKVIYIGYRKVGDVGHTVNEDTPDDVQAYEKPTVLVISPGIVEVRFRPAPEQFKQLVTINAYGEPAMNLAVLTGFCQYAVQEKKQSTARDFKVGIGFGGYTDTVTGKKGFRIIGTNLDAVPIQELKFDFVFEYEKPMEKEMLGPDDRPMAFSEVGGGVGLCLALGQKEGPVEPGESRAYLLPVQVMDHVRELIHELPAERYRIDMTAGGKTEVAISGQVVGEFIRRELSEQPTTTTTPMPDQEGHLA